MLRRLLAPLGVAYALLLAPALGQAQTANPGLPVVDALHTTRTTCAANPVLGNFQGLWPCHLTGGVDAGGLLHPAKTDAGTEGAPEPFLVDLSSALPAGGNVIGGVTESGAWTFGLTGSLPGFASTPTFNIGTSSLALESGGNVAASKADLDSILSSHATAANQTNVQANAGSAPTKLVGVQGAAGMTPVLTTPRVLVVTTTVTIGASYTAGQDVGGALSIAAGIGNNTPYRIRNITLAWTVASATAVGGVELQVFNASLASTITDGAIPTFVSADAVKFAAAFAIGDTTAGSTNTGLFYALTTVPPLPRSAQTDGSGNINAVALANAAITDTTPQPATLRIEIEY